LLQEVDDLRRVLDHDSTSLENRHTGAGGELSGGSHVETGQQMTGRVGDLLEIERPTRLFGVVREPEIVELEHRASCRRIPPACTPGGGGVESYGHVCLSFERS